MAFNLESITTERAVKAPRIVLLGVEKIGKTTFAASGGNPIFIPVKGEEGVDAIQVGKFPTCETINDVMQCLYSLYTGTHNYDRVVIDSASALEPIGWIDACARNVDKNGNSSPVDSIEKFGGGYGKGYTESLNIWRRITEALDILRNDRGMVSIIIGHVKVKRFDDPNGESYDQYQFDVHDKISSMLYRWADCILFANSKVMVKKEDVGFGKDKARGVDITGGSRFLYTQKRPAHPGGGRDPYGKLPYELPLDWDTFIQSVSAVS